MFNEYFKIALRNLKSRSLRSWLTILGIIIGIFLVVSLLSLSEGLKESVMRELRMMGGDIIMVIPGDVSDMMTTMIGGMELKDRDIEAIQRAEGVETVLEMPWGAVVVRHLQETQTSLIYGIDFIKGIPILRENMGWEVVDGEFPRPGRREVMVGNLIPKEIFPEMLVGDTISVKGRKFIVSGVLRSLGNRQDDSTIAMDLNDFKDVTGKREGSPVGLVKVKADYDTDLVVRNIEEELEKSIIRRRDEDSPSFTVMSSETVTDMVESIMGILQLAVFAFASIAIVVGGIGITNTMYTSIKERTKEIGVLKAVGAKRKHISYIFLFEAGIIGLVGGIGGVFLGLVLAFSLNIILAGLGTMFHLKAHVSPFIVIFGLLFSFVVGCLSGFLPAKKAARMEPVDALRYE